MSNSTSTGIQSTTTTSQSTLLAKVQEQATKLADNPKARVLIRGYPTLRAGDITLILLMYKLNQPVRAIRLATTKPEVIALYDRIRRGI